MSFKSLFAAAIVVAATFAFAPEAEAITVTYSNISGTGFQYTQNGVRHRSYYNSFSNNGHYHSNTNDYIWYHSGCCSNRARIDMANGTTFTMSSLTRRRSGSSSWTAYNAAGSSVGSVSISGSSGVYNFPANWTNLSRVDIVFSSGQFGWDNLEVNTCTVTADAGGPYSVAEGSSVTLSAAASTATGGTLTYAWDFDSGSGTGPFNDATGVGPSFDADTSTGAALNGPASATVGVQASCSGVVDDDTATVNVTNVAPTVSETIPTTADEGDTVSFSVSATDPGPDTLTYLWDFGDGNSSTQQNPTHVYSDDSTGQTNGYYTVTVTVSDGADSTQASGNITVANLAPSVTTLSGPSTGDEGSTLTFSAFGTDPGPVDNLALTYSWDWGDGTTGSGTSPSHAWDDDSGTTYSSPYTVTLTITDPQGATDTDTQVVTIGNVAPSITSSPVLTADEAVEWTYQATAVDPGTDTITWSLSASAPAGMTLAPLTGAISWTPTFADVGTASFTLTADDGDGGQDVQSVTLTIGFTDAEGDGLPDTWETDNGLDPTIDDSGLDPDGDGVSNLDEYLGGTDPNVFDGPDVPVQISPIDGAEVADSRPTLTWDPANDPNGDDLTYDVEVYEDAGLAVLLTSTTGVDGLTWQVDTPLAENMDAYWRVRADDGNVAGTYSALAPFFVNETNEAPGEPGLLFPADEETVATLRPEANMSEATDVDRDALGYRIRVWLDETMVTEGWLDPVARDVTWEVDVDLEEDTWYSWDARAEDEHGLAGEWAEAELFFVSTENAAPVGTWFVDPLDGDVVDSVSPALEATEGEDPEGGELTYAFEVDTAASFDSGDLATGTVEASDTGTVTWDLAAEGVELTENTTWNARVRAEDEGGVGSAWDTIEFFVRGDNDAPPTPALVSPEDGAVLGEAAPIVAIGHVVDPEGDTVFYEIAVARDAELTDIVGSVEGLVEGSGPEGTVDQATWQLTERVNGTWYWSARAVDEHGAASDWAEAWSFSFDDSDPVPPPDDTGDCSCTNSLASASSAGPLALLLLVIPALRRRRS